MLWCYLCLMFPSIAALGAITMEAWKKFFKWLIGPGVWALAVWDAKGCLISTPTLQHVMSYDVQARKSIMTLMNSGMGFVSAIKAVQTNATHFSVHFLHLVSLRPSNTVSAPGVTSEAGSKWLPAGVAKLQLEWDDAGDNVRDKSASAKESARKAQKTHMKEVRRCKEGEPERWQAGQAEGHSGRQTCNK